MSRTDASPRERRARLLFSEITTHASDLHRILTTADATAAPLTAEQHRQVAGLRSLIGTAQQEAADLADGSGGADLWRHAARRSHDAAAWHELAAELIESESGQSLLAADPGGR